MMDCTNSKRGLPRSVREKIRLCIRVVLRRSSLSAESMKPLRRRSLVDDSGAALIEFAVSAAVLFMMLLGIIQVCYALYVYSYVSDAARVATRYAIVRGSNCTGMPDCNATSTQIQSYLRNIPYPGMSANNLTATATWLSVSTTPPTTWTACGTPCKSPGNAVQVQVTYQFPLNIPYWKNATVNISSTSQMVISN